MAEPILIYAYDEEEVGVPLSDEDVARGHLEEGWVPMLRPRPKNAAVPPDALNGFLHCLGCAWPVLGCGGAWIVLMNHPRYDASIRKCRLPIAEDEELVIEPTDNVNESMVYLCEAPKTAELVTHVAVCYNMGDIRLRLIGDPYGLAFGLPQGYHFFVICKQPRTSFVLK